MVRTLLHTSASGIRRRGGIGSVSRTADNMSLRSGKLAGQFLDTPAHVVYVVASLYFYSFYVAGPVEELITVTLAAGPAAYVHDGVRFADWHKGTLTNGRTLPDWAAAERVIVFMGLMAAYGVPLLVSLGLVARRLHRSGTAGHCARSPRGSGDAPKNTCRGGRRSEGADDLRKLTLLVVTTLFVFLVLNRFAELLAVCFLQGCSAYWERGVRFADRWHGVLTSGKALPWWTEPFRFVFMTVATVAFVFAADRLYTGLTSLIRNALSNHKR
jgi:hypothetical protein